MISDCSRLANCPLRYSVCTPPTPPTADIKDGIMLKRACGSRFIVTLGWIIGKPLTLLFDPYESIVLFLAGAFSLRHSAPHIRRFLTLAPLSWHFHIQSSSSTIQLLTANLTGWKACCLCVSISCSQSLFGIILVRRPSRCRYLPSFDTDARVIGVNISQQLAQC